VALSCGIGCILVTGTCVLWCLVPNIHVDNNGDSAMSIWSAFRHWRLWVSCDILKCLTTISFCACAQGIFCTTNAQLMLRGSNQLLLFGHSSDFTLPTYLLLCIYAGFDLLAELMSRKLAYMVNARENSLAFMVLSAAGVALMMAGVAFSVAAILPVGGFLVSFSAGYATNAGYRAVDLHVPKEANFVAHSVISLLRFGPIAILFATPAFGVLVHFSARKI